MRQLLLLIFLFLYCNLLVYCQHFEMFSHFLQDETRIEQDVQITKIAKYLVENNVDTNSFKFIPVFRLKYNMSSVDILNYWRDSLIITVGEILIIKKKSFNYIGSQIICKSGIEYYFFPKHSGYDYLATFPCSFDNRINEKPLFRNKKLNKLIKITKGQVLLFRIPNCESIFYINSIGCGIISL